MVKSIAKVQSEYVKRSAKTMDAPGERAIRIMEHTIEETYERTFCETREYQRKLFEITYANLHAQFQLLRELLSVNSPSELEAVYIKHSQRQFEACREQAAELWSLAQKAMIENMGPIGLSVGNALIGQVEYA